LLCLVPKGDIQKTLAYLNSEEFKKDYMYAGRFKIGHKQISTAILPTEILNPFFPSLSLNE